MARLDGLARPTDYLFLEHVPGGADHTYVRSSGGAQWGCGGGTDGGRVITSGHGSHTLARKLARRNYGGMVYGTTGVCHQMANRVLYPSGKNVHRAKGAGWSYTVYGVYGRPHAAWLSWRAACEAETGRIPNPLPIPLPRIPRPRIPRPRWPRFAAHTGLDLAPVADLDELNLATNPDEELLTFADDEWQDQEMVAVSLLAEAANATTQEIDDAQFESFLKVRSDGEISDEAIVNIMNVRAELENERWKLTSAYSNGEQTKPEFVKNYGNMLTERFAQIERCLGPALYEKIYDLPPDHSPAIINPEAIQLEA